MAFVQGTGVQSVGAVTSQAKAFASNVAAGNLIAVAVGTYPSAGSTPRTHSFSDTLSNSYSSAVINTGVTGDTAPANQIAYAKDIAGGACTVTVTPSASAYTSFGIVEFSGRDLTAPLDSNTGSGDDTDTTPTTGNFVTNDADDMIGGMSHNGSTTTIAVGTGWTLLFEAEDAANTPIGTEYRSSAAGTYAATWTLGASRNSLAVAAAFLPAAVTAKAPPPYHRSQRIYRRAG